MRKFPNIIFFGDMLTHGMSLWVLTSWPPSSNRATMRHSDQLSSQILHQKMYIVDGVYLFLFSPKVHLLSSYSSPSYLIWAWSKENVGKTTDHQEIAVMILSSSCQGMLRRLWTKSVLTSNHKEFFIGLLIIHCSLLANS